MVHVVECLLSKYKALSSNTSPTKKKGGEEGRFHIELRVV
jgi:hypothetical protein